MPPTKTSHFEVNVRDEIASSVATIALSMMNAIVYQQSTSKILARKGFSFRSFGEWIEVHIAPIRGDQSKISIVSKSTSPTTLIDWGVNAENTQRFEQLVKQLINLVQLLDRQKS